MHRQADRLVGLFLLGWVLLTPPLLMLPTGSMIGGIPAPYLYINAIWLTVVVLIVRLTRREDGEPPEPEA